MGWFAKKTKKTETFSLLKFMGSNIFCVGKDGKGRAIVLLSLRAQEGMILGCHNQCRQQKLKCIYFLPRAKLEGVGRWKYLLEQVREVLGDDGEGPSAHGKMEALPGLLTASMLLQTHVHRLGGRGGR